MPNEENCPPQILLPKNREGTAVTCMNKYISTRHCSTLEKKEFMCLLSFSILLPPCGAFSMLALYCNPFSHSGLAAGSHYVPKQLQSSSSPELLCQDESPLSELHSML